MAQEPSDNLTLIGLTPRWPSYRKGDGWLTECSENVYSFHVRFNLEAHFEKDDTEGIHIGLSISPRNGSLLTFSLYDLEMATSGAMYKLVPIPDVLSDVSA